MSKPKRKDRSRLKRKPDHNASCPKNHPNNKRDDIPVHVTEMPANSEPSDKGNKQGEHCRPDQTPVFKIILEVTAASIGVGVLLIYSLQLRQMIEANRFNRDSLLAVQRAFIVPDAQPTVNKFIDFASGARVPAIDGRMNWVNQGTTPAIRMVEYFAMDNHTPSEWEFQGVPMPHPLPMTTVGPKETAHSGRATIKMANSYDPKAGVLVGTLPVFYWGWAVYSDIFPGTERHVTETCGELKSVSKVDNSENVNLAFTLCATHNCTDKQCDDYSEMVKFAEGK